jgi:general secretion pathway protein B
MSYILDALKRAEQQRGGAGRGAVRVPRAIPTQRASRGPWPWIAAAGVGLGAVVAVVALWPTSAPPPSVTSAPSETPPLDAGTTAGAPARPPARPANARDAGRPGPTPTPPPADRRLAAPAERRAPASTPVPAATERSTARIAVPPTADRGRGPSAASPAGDSGAGASRAPLPSAGSSSAAGASRAPITTDPVTPGGRAAPPVVRLPPRVEERPPLAPGPQFSRAMPTRPGPPEPPVGAKAMAAKITLQVLSWAPEPRDRFVFLNGRRYGEGQLVDDKLLVEHITEDGVILSFQGERVTIRGR